jgi:hypothetical protein
MMLNLPDNTKKAYMTFATYRRIHRTTLRTCDVAGVLFDVVMFNMNF